MTDLIFAEAWLLSSSSFQLERFQNTRKGKNLYKKRELSFSIFVSNNRHHDIQNQTEWLRLQLTITVSVYSITVSQFA